MGSMRTSALLGVLTAVLTPPLALLAAMAARELRAPRVVLLLVLMPLFIPGVSMGLPTAVFFRLLGVPSSLWTILSVHVLWSLPFAFLIILTAMATFDPVYLEAAYVHGADRVRAFLDVELPLIRPGIIGTATFSLILSLNETVRTSLVQGPLNTVQTYILSTYVLVGLSPTLYALMSLPWRVLHLPGPKRLRQVDDPAHHRGPGASRVGTGANRGEGHGAGSAVAAGAGDGLPAVRALPQHERRPEHRLRAAGA